MLLSIGYLLPQALFVPPMQQAINRRAADRIKTLRRVSGDIAPPTGAKNQGATAMTTSNPSGQRIPHPRETPHTVVFSHPTNAGVQTRAAEQPIDEPVFCAPGR